MHPFSSIFVSKRRKFLLNFAEVESPWMNVFVVIPNYRTEIDYRGEYFLVDITPNRVTNITNLQCHFETVHLKRMPNQKLIISMSDVCFALIEKQAMLETAVFHDLNNSTLEIKVESVEQDSSRRLGCQPESIFELSERRDLVWTWKLDARVVDQPGWPVEPETSSADGRWQHTSGYYAARCYCKTDALAFGSIHSQLQVLLGKQKCFCVAFEGVKDDDECGPNLTFLLFDYNSVDISKFAFTNLEILCQGDNFKLVRWVSIQKLSVQLSRDSVQMIDVIDFMSKNCVSFAMVWSSSSLHRCDR